MARAKPTRVQTQALTRRRLLDAARQLVATGGLAEASVRTVSEAAGYSVGAFYSNFPSKEELLFALMQDHMAQEAAELDALLRASCEQPNKLLERVCAWADRLNSEIDWSTIAVELALYARRSPTFGERFYDQQTKHREVLGSIIDRLFTATGRSSAIPPSALAAMMMAVAQGMTLQRSEQSPDPAGQAIHALIDAVARPA